MLQSRTHHTAPGFTLVETLMVLAIMMILFAAAASGLKKSWQGQEIRASAIHLAHDIALATQTAAKFNKPVELRFYKYYDQRVANEMPQFFGWQLLMREPSSADAKGKSTPLYELQRCEGTTVMSQHRIGSSMCSTILNTKSIQPVPQRDPELGNGPYEFVSVEFSPSGRTNLDPDAPEPWTITMIPITWVDHPGEMPKEFQVVGLDARSGAVRIW